jgi:GAF domain-containing protein
MPSVFYNPAPYPPCEVNRQAVVDRLLALDLEVAELHLVASKAADVFGTTMSAVTMLDRDCQRLIAKVGLSVATTSRVVSFCGHTIHHCEPFCVEDAQLDLRFAGNPLVVRAPSIRFYVGAPIIVEGQPIGAVCAISSEAQSVAPSPKLGRLVQLALNASSCLEAQLRDR